VCSATVFREIEFILAQALAKKLRNNTVTLWLKENEGGVRELYFRRTEGIRSREENREKTMSSSFAGPLKLGGKRALSGKRAAVKVPI